MSRVLVANNGALAVTAADRFARAGLDVYTAEAGPGAWRLARVGLPVTFGPGASNDPFEDADAMLGAVGACSPDYVFTGYGALSEEPGFATACQQHGSRWLGAEPHVLARAQDKLRTVELASQLGVPVLDHCLVGAGGDPGDAVALLSRSDGVVIKPVGGHGGALLVVRDRPALLQALSRAGGCLVETYAPDAVTVGVHVLRTPDGHVEDLAYSRSLLERGGKKLCESIGGTDTSPAGALVAAGALVSAMDLVGIATVEFLRHPGGELTFLEVNARLPLSFQAVEAVAGVDLILAQLDLARGLLPARSAPRAPHAAELRVFADSQEDKEAMTFVHEALGAESFLSDASSGEQGAWLLQRLVTGASENDCRAALAARPGYRPAASGAWEILDGSDPGQADARKDGT